MKARSEAWTPELIQKAFRVTGVWPFNPHAISRVRIHDVELIRSRQKDLRRIDTSYDEGPLQDTRRELYKILGCAAEGSLSTISLTDSIKQCIAKIQEYDTLVETARYATMLQERDREEKERVETELTLENEKKKKRKQAESLCRLSQESLSSLLTPELDAEGNTIPLLPENDAISDADSDDERAPKFDYNDELEEHQEITEIDILC